MEKKNIISICVRSLSTSAEADWVTPSEALEFMELQKEKDGSEEFIIIDSNAPFAISEYDSVSELVEIAEQLENLTDEEIEVLEVIMENYTDNFNEALEKVVERDYIVYSDCQSMAEVAECYLEESGMMAEIPDFIKSYIDFESYGYNMEIGGNFFDLPYHRGIVEII